MKGFNPATVRCWAHKTSAPKGILKFLLLFHGLKMLLKTKQEDTLPAFCKVMGTNGQLFRVWGKFGDPSPREEAWEGVSSNPSQMPLTVPGKFGAEASFLIWVSPAASVAPRLICICAGVLKMESELVENVLLTSSSTSKTTQLCSRNFSAPG